VVGVVVVVVVAVGVGVVVVVAVGVGVGVVVAVAVGVGVVVVVGALMVTCLIPTLGRPTLNRAVESALSEPGVEDVWVVADGRLAYEAAKAQLAHRLNSPHVTLTPVNGGPMGDWGHSIRAMFGAYCKAPWVVWMNDDVTFNPLALTDILRGAGYADILLCDVQMENGGVLPGDYPLRMGMVDCFGIVTRTEFLKRCPWPDKAVYEADWLFFEAARKAGAIIKRVPITIGRRYPIGVTDGSMDNAASDSEKQGRIQVG
jgi:hypothetical protein